MPCADDLRLYAKYAENLRQAQAVSGKPGLLLGCTQLMSDWCKESGLRVTVMDFCEPLARSLQSRHQEWEGLRIIIDDWLSTSLAGASFCWAAGDGVVNAVGAGRETIRLFRQIHRLLLPGSIVILRNFFRSDPTPSAAEVLAKFAVGRIRSLNAFQHQLSSSLQPSFMEGVFTRETYKLMQEHHAIPAEQLGAFDYYNTENAALCYPTMAELRELTHGDFEELEMSCGNYEMSELTPTIVYRSRVKD